MSPSVIAPQGLELIWVNASPTGPIANDSDLSQHQFIRIRAGQDKIICRSGSEPKTAIVNDLSEKVFLPFAKVVSREHAKIEWLDGKPLIKDLGSTHGTFVADRMATFSHSTGKFVENNASAPLQPVSGVHALHDGDLIEFGKACSRSEAHYQPVRCFVRFLPRNSASSISAMTSKNGGAVVSPAKSTRSYGLDDDSSSEIVAIDAETFRAGSQRHSQSRTSTTESQPRSQSTSPTALPSAHVGMLNQVFIEDEDEWPSEDSELYSDENAESDSDIDVEPFVPQLVPLHQHEAAAELSDLLDEAQAARTEGENYMAGFREDSVEGNRTSAADNTLTTSSSMASITPEIQASNEAETTTTTPTAVATPAPCAAEPSSSRNATLSTLSTHEAPPASIVIGLPTESNLRSELSDLEPSSSDQVAEAAVESQRSAMASETPSEVSAISTLTSALSSFAQKRKTQDAEFDIASSSDEAELASSSEAESCSSAGPSTPETSPSGSPSPTKRRRFSLGSRNVRHPEPPAHSRIRRIGAFVGKATYTATLLSTGFLAGSLFTFKSMMNAAAAANASGLGKQ